MDVKQDRTIKLLEVLTADSCRVWKPEPQNKLPVFFIFKIQDKYFLTTRLQQEQTFCLKTRIIKLNGLFFNDPQEKQTNF